MITMLTTFANFYILFEHESIENPSDIHNCHHGFITLVTNFLVDIKAPTFIDFSQCGY